MPQLVPHLLLRSEIGSSEAAIMLRDGGYVVTKIVDDDSVIRLARSPHVDAIVVELPAFLAVPFVRRIQNEIGTRLPVLVLTNAPGTVQRHVNASVLHIDNIEDDLISATDLMLAAHESRRAFQKSRDAILAEA